MGVFTRRLIKENLDQVSVFLEDTRNEIFVVQDLPDTFGQGRTAFAAIALIGPWAQLDFVLCHAVYSAPYGHWKKHVGL